MLNKFYSIFALVGICLCLSCSDNTEVVHSMGKAVYYDDFLWYDYVPDTLKKHLVFEFFDDAKTDNTSFVMGFYEKDDNGSLSPMGTEVAQVFINGEPTTNNQFVVSNKVGGAIVNQVDIEVGVVFNSEAESKQHHWEIKVLDDNKDIEIIEIEDDTTTVINFDARKEDKMNPLAKGILIVLAIIIGAYLLWILIFRKQSYPHFTYNEIEIKYPSRSDVQTVKVKGYCSLILTNKEIEQGFFKKLFNVCDAVEVNEIWTTTVVIKPKGKYYLRVIGDVVSIPDEPEQREPFKLKTYDGVEIKFQ